MPPLRRLAARALDVAAVVVVVAALARFVVLPRLHATAVIAPSLRLATLDGPPFAIAGRPHRVVFLDFWTSWCDPCRDSIPLVQHFRRTHPQADVVSIDVGEPSLLVRPFVARFAMHGVALDPDETAAHAFGINGFPTLIAIDSQAHVHLIGVGFDAQVERAMSDALDRYAAR